MFLEIKKNFSNLKYKLRRSRFIIFVLKFNQRRLNTKNISSVGIICGLAVILLSYQNCAPTKFTLATDQSSRKVLTIYACQGAPPANANLCPGDETSLAANANRLVVDVCSNGVKCEYTCATNYFNTNGVCSACTGTSLLTQHPNCPAGQTGQITQTRTVLATTCPTSGQYVFTYSDWMTISNTCAAIPSPVVTAVSSGWYHTCAIVNGGVQCWGDNTYGQLGDGTKMNRLTPVQVSGLPSGSGVTAISANLFFTCAIVRGGVQCWGLNSHNVLGEWTIPNRITAYQIPGFPSGSGVTAIATDADHVCVIINSKAQCWGGNFYGGLGDGSKTDRDFPVQVLGLTGNVTAISTFSYRSCAVVNGAAMCWGEGRYGELGNGTTGNWDGQISQTTPVQATGLSSGVSAISTGGTHTCSIVNGGVLCWGANSNGQLGDGITADKEPSPVQATGLTSGVSAISTGGAHTCAIVNGGVQCWGANTNGLLGTGTAVNRQLVPGQVLGLPSGSGVRTISAGSSHTCVLVNSVVDALSEVRLQLDRGNGEAIKEEHQVDAVLVVPRVAHLPNDA